MIVPVIPLPPLLPPGPAQPAPSVDRDCRVSCTNWPYQQCEVAELDPHHFQGFSLAPFLFL